MYGEASEASAERRASLFCRSVPVYGAGKERPRVRGKRAKRAQSDAPVFSVFSLQRKPEDSNPRPCGPQRVCLKKRVGTDILRRPWPF